MKKDYTETIDNLSNNLIEFATRYGKDVIVCEIGGEDTNASNNYDMLKEVMIILNSCYISSNKCAKIMHLNGVTRYLSEY